MILHLNKSKIHQQDNQWIVDIYLPDIQFYIYKIQMVNKYRHLHRLDNLQQYILSLDKITF